MSSDPIAFKPRVELTPDFVQEYKTAYQSQSSYPKEAALEESLKIRLAGHDHITKDLLLGIIEWKAPRVQGHIEKNDPNFVIEISRASFTAQDERTKIEVLLKLDGISWPVASTVLHFRYPNRYAVVDFRALWSLGLDRPPPYNFQFWKLYNDFIVSEADRLGVSIRDLDKALWAFSKTHQKPS